MVGGWRAVLLPPIEPPRRPAYDPTAHLERLRLRHDTVLNEPGERQIERIACGAREQNMVHVVVGHSDEPPASVPNSTFCGTNVRCVRRIRANSRVG